MVGIILSVILTLIALYLIFSVFIGGLAAVFILDQENGNYFGAILALIFSPYLAYILILEEIKKRNESTNNK